MTTVRRHPPPPQKKTSKFRCITLFQIPLQFNVYTLCQLTLAYACHWIKILSFLLIFNTAGYVRIQETLRCVRVTIVAVKKQEVLLIMKVCLPFYLSSMKFACAVLYCHMCLFWLNHTFPHYLIHGKIFWTKIIGHQMCVLIFSSNLVWKISHSKKKWARYFHKCT